MQTYRVVVRKLVEETWEVQADNMDAAFHAAVPGVGTLVGSEEVEATDIMSIEPVEPATAGCCGVLHPCDSIESQWPRWRA